MATKILVLKTAPRRDKGEDYSLLMFFPVNPLIVVNSVTVVETPSTGLPGLVAKYNLLSPQELGALDNGSYVWYGHTLTRHYGVSVNQIMEKAKTAWAAQEAKIVPALRVKYQSTGLQVTF